MRFNINNIGLVLCVFLLTSCVYTKFEVYNSVYPYFASLIRLYNPNAKAGSHHYTLSEGEKDYLVQVGWRYEGISWNAIGLGKPASHSSNNSSVENHSGTISESGIYPNCEAARRAGVTPIYRGQPAYSSKLDKDGDGVACEK